MQSAETLNICNSDPVSSSLDLSQLETIRSDYLRDLEKLRKKYAGKIVKLVEVQNSTFYSNHL